MKKRKFNAVLSLLLVVSLILGQPAVINAEELADVTVTEEGNGITVEDETLAGTDDEVDTEDEAGEIPQTPDEENGDGTSDDADNNDDEVQEPENGEAQNPDEEVTEPSDAEENVDDETAADAEKVGNEPERKDSDISALSVEKKRTLDEFGFKTMDLTAQMIQEKRELDMVAATVKVMKANTDYVENEIVYTADSEEEAKEIAECYGGTLITYEDGLSAASIEQKVSDAIIVAADMEIPIPAVYPNIIYTADLDMQVTSVEDVEVTIKEVAEKTGETDGLSSIDEVDVEHEDPDAVDDGDLYPYFDYEAYADPSEEHYQWHHSVINTVEAWDATKGSGITVAVLDSGIDWTHPDLKDNIVGHISTYGDDGEDKYGHGTMCAGVIAAAKNNVGVVGIAPEASIYSVKILGDTGSGDTVHAIQGMRSAISRNVDVMSMSFGSFYYDALFQKEIDAAVKKGIILVAAAGNENVSQKMYPAAYNNVIAVGATAPTYSYYYLYNGETSERRTTYWFSEDDGANSNYGTWVDIAAPGESIASTLPTNRNVIGTVRKDDGTTTYITDYGTASGTSLSCPMVSATLALMLANSSELRNMNSKAGVTKMIKTIVDSSVQGGATKYDDYGYVDSRYPFLDVEATTYAVDTTVPAMPSIKFSGGDPTSKNVVKAGYYIDENGVQKTYKFQLINPSPHAKVYYTINGKKPSAKDGVRYIYDANGEGQEIDMLLSGKVKIQAVTVVGNKTSKVFSKTYTFDVKTLSLSSPYNNIKDNITIAIGKSIQLSVNPYPSYVTNKKLEWRSDDATGMIKVNKSTGKVTCNKNATEGLTTTITAKAADGSKDINGNDIEYKFTVKATNEKVEFFELNATSLKMSYWANDMQNQSTPMKDPDQTEYHKTFQLRVDTPGITTEQYLYKSSNTKVATVSNNGRITALAKGKAKITVTANDGSGKKAVCDVTVVTPVFDIYAYSNTGYSGDGVIPIGTGCTITLKTEINYNSKTSYYVPNNKKLEWTSSNPLVTVKNGKVKCASNATPQDPFNRNPNEIVWITATAVDGYNTSYAIPFVIVDKIEKIYYYENGKKYPGAKANMEVGGWIYDPLTEIDPKTDGYMAVDTMHNTGYDFPYYDVSISNKDVIFRYSAAFTDAAGNFIGYHNVVDGTKPGSAKLTYTARDGSNKKFTVNFKITKRTLQGL